MPQVPLKYGYRNKSAPKPSHPRHRLKYRNQWLQGDLESTRGRNRAIEQRGSRATKPNAHPLSFFAPRLVPSAQWSPCVETQTSNKRNQRVPSQGLHQLGDECIVQRRRYYSGSTMPGANSAALAAPRQYSIA